MKKLLIVLVSLMVVLPMVSTAEDKKQPVKVVKEIKKSKKIKKR